MPKTIKTPKDVGLFIAHFSETNAEDEHKHVTGGSETKAGSFTCDQCGEMILDAQASDPKNYIGYEVS